MTDYPGIDYGLGRTNIDTQTGIRFGVIHANDVAWWHESSEPEYGAPHCPRCGNEAIAGVCRTEQHENGVTVWCDHPENTEDYETDGCADYRCDDCRYMFDSSDAFGDEPLAWTLDNEEYRAIQSGDDCDIFITKSPYFTRAQYCSPCAPGAAYLRNPCDDGPRAYCFGADWFDSDRPCPYPVYRVDEIDPVTGADGPARYTPAIETDVDAE